MLKPERKRFSALIHGAQKLASLAHELTESINEELRRALEPISPERMLLENLYAIRHREPSLEEMLEDILTSMGLERDSPLIRALASSRERGVGAEETTRNRRGQPHVRR
ncbi:hypothetical protein Pyrfu_0082 [Pyrolobus fumarii 1A]|uniref:Uncharacterized protein n=1 Tax=Pyrolobus fumarii (strain DSM 11204 / 1A) TaxID=694429 RepID=G0EE38_PYRF1|nr:hypothetical protein [Pyrolobus fumarii]AEM37954.1 hypothetical protein Pyrfu_0082 [Pyrolobus fumarii 1A]